MATQERSQRHALNDWRRHRAWALHQEDWKGAAIAAALAVIPGAVSQWLKKAREGGAVALSVRIPPGATPKLSAEQGAQLPEVLAHGAEAYGFLGDVWTTKRVAAMIRREFNVSYHWAHVIRLPRTRDRAVQKPVFRATPRDEAGIAAWTAER